jgi:hypothetical protein
MRIDLRKIIDQYDLPVTKVCKTLFPEKMYPMNSTRRVLKGSQDLNSEQIYRLAKDFNITIDQIFNHTWLVTKLGSGVTQYSKSGIRITQIENGSLFAEYRGVKTQVSGTLLEIENKLILQ